MQTIELEIEDRKKVIEFVNHYKRIHIEIEMTIKKLEALTEEKDDLLNELVELRKAELLFVEEFKEKYGEGNLDLETGQYKLK